MAYIIKKMCVMVEADDPQTVGTLGRGIGIALSSMTKQIPDSREICDFMGAVERQSGNFGLQDLRNAFLNKKSEVWSDFTISLYVRATEKGVGIFHQIVKDVFKMAEDSHELNIRNIRVQEPAEAEEEVVEEMNNRSNRKPVSSRDSQGPSPHDCMYHNVLQALLRK